MKNIQINDIKSLAHTQWNCKYHIVFVPKYRINIHQLMDIYFKIYHLRFILVLTFSKRSNTEATIWPSLAIF